MHPDRVAVRYFDGTLTAAEVDVLSDALAVALSELGTRSGDRVGIHLQNIPQYSITLIALWKLGAVALILNPMYQGSELRKLVDDARPIGFICGDADVDASSATLAGSTVGWMLSTSSLDLQTRNDPRVFSATARGRSAAQGDLLQLIAAHRGQRPSTPDPASGDIALLTYTSGTTGPAKGAMNTHGNLLAVASTYGAWANLSPGDVVFGMAPLFHITGAVVNATVALLNDTTLVLANRFHPEVALETFLEHGVTFTIGSITAYNAMSQVPTAGPEHFASAKHLYSGGAPIPPATVERFEERFGVYLHNGYGLTETSSCVIAVPAGARAPVHEPSGTLSVGRPLPHLSVRVLDSEGNPLPPGEQGELEVSGPQIVPGYWENPNATEAAMPGGRLRTGDVAIMDKDGWIYLVDRLKDQINVSGYKVWPREVEDVLYRHPDVREAAVVGEPDDYRGESVAAYVSLVAGAVPDPGELISFARSHLAAYKAPRRIVIVDEVPKTQTGKIRRNVLREHGSSADQEGSA
jgi:long-chain acyl-CoA synthetase